MRKWKSKDGRVILFCGDCLEVLPTLDHPMVDMVAADLPYGTTACKWDSVIPFKPLWKCYDSVIKTNAAIVLNASQPFTSALVMSNSKEYKHSWVWEKNCPSNIACGDFQPMRYTEDVLVFSKDKPVFNRQMIERAASGAAIIKQYKENKTTFKLSKSKVSSLTGTEVGAERYSTEMKNPSNLIYFGVERGKAHVHPTQKPVALMEYLIKTYTNKDELVLDNTMGSGTTGVACIRTSRRFIGIEKEEEYFEIAVKRIEKAFSDRGLFK